MVFKNIKLKFSSLFKTNLVRDTSWIFIGRIFRVIVQAIYFIIIARVLGAEQYGSFIAVTALASILFPFIALGSEHVLVKYVAIDKSLFRVYWCNTLFILINHGTILVTILLLLSPLIFSTPISLTTILIILIADLLCLAILDVCFKALIAVNLVQKSSELGIINSISKLIAAVALAVFFEKPTVRIWADLYLLSSLIMAAAGIILVNELVGKPKPTLSKVKPSIQEGIYFAISASASNINADIDKTMLASMSTLTATGLYGSAYRFIDVGYVVLSSLFTASYTRFFQHGAAGIANSLGFAKRLFPFIVGYGALTLVGYFFFAPLLPKILGAEYTGAVPVLRWLAPLPFIASLQFLAADTLTGAGFQRSRSMVQVGAALINLGLNFWLIPLYSWKGATIATLASDSFRAITLWIMVAYLYRRERKANLINT
jgi:O-antigen/teichoic acid export membrane protein